jgi:hypothetical protein
MLRFSRERGHRNAITSDLCNEIRQNRKACNHLELFSRRCWTSPPEDANDKITADEISPSSHHVSHAALCRCVLRRIPMRPRRPPATDNK